MSKSTTTTNNDTRNLGQSAAARWIQANFDRTEWTGGPGRVEDITRGVDHVADTIDAAPEALRRLATTPPLPEELGFDWADISAERAERFTDAFDALAGFLRSEEAARLFCGFDGAAPETVFVSPRRGYVSPARPRPTDPEPPVEGHVVYECEITRKRFSLPIGAPVPALYFDAIENPDEPARRGIELIIHPRLYEAGQAAIYRALWGLAGKALHGAFAKLSDALVYASMVCFFGPNEIGDAPETALQITGWQDAE